MGRFVTMMATKVSRQAQELPLTAPSGPAWGKGVLANHGRCPVDVWECLPLGSSRHEWCLPA